jgi:hypothetical protein
MNPQQLKVAVPINDTQLIALIAAQAPHTTDPVAAVKWAAELVGEAIASGVQVMSEYALKKKPELAHQNSSLQLAPPGMQVARNDKKLLQ